MHICVSFLFFCLIFTNLMQYKHITKSNIVICGTLHAASLGVASRITVTIAASDDAHGVFQFSPNSLSVNGTEPEDGRSSVVLQVSKIQSKILKMSV